MEIKLFACLICVGLFASLMFGVLVINVYQNCCRGRYGQELSKVLVILNAATILTSFMVSMFDFGHIYLAIKYDETVDSRFNFINKFIWDMADILWFLSYLLLYVTLFQRLRISFMNSQYKISIKCQIMFWLLLVVTIGAMVLSLWSYITSNYESSQYPAFVLIGSDLVISVSLATIFTVNIKSIVNTLNGDLAGAINTSCTTTTDTKKTTSIQLNESMKSNVSKYKNSNPRSSMDDIIMKSNKLEFVMVRQMVLGFVSIFTTQIILIFNAIWIIIHIYTTINTGTLSLIFYILRSLDGLITSISLLLSFNINKSIYTRLCSGSHIICKRCCITS